MTEEEQQPEKPKEKIDDVQDEMEKFDEMERVFHSVVQNLVTDNSLDNFRQEYEKLHQALVISHEHNTMLVEKCKALNNEILANANKVSSVLTLSQNDQRTIAGLRHEFEKAWKLVEVSQEKENKCEEVIEGLKKEVSNLSRLVEQGGQLAFTQTASLQEVTDEIQQLKKEITTQTVQFESMKKEVEETQAKHIATKEELVNITKEFGELTESIEIEKTNNLSISKDTDSTHSEIKKVKEEYKALENKLSDIDGQISTKKESIFNLNSVLREDQREIKSANEDIRMNMQMVHTIQKVLEDKQKLNAKIKDQIDSFDLKFKNKDELKADLMKELTAANEENERNKTEYDELKTVQRQISEEKNNTRIKLNDYRQKIHILTAQHYSSMSKVAGVRRNIEKGRTDLHAVISKKNEEKEETRFVESQNDVILSEMLGMKEISHDQRKKIAKTKNEIDQYQLRTSDSRSNHIQVAEEIRMREEQIDERKVYLSGIYQQIKRQDGMLETMQNERDLSSRQLEIANSENEAMADENKALLQTIKSLKDDIREKDKLCLQTHMKAKKIDAGLSNLAKETETMRDKIKDLDTLCTEYRNKIQRNIYLISQGELNSKKQKQVVTDLSFSTYSLNTSLSKKTSEVEILRQKVETVKDLLTMGSLSYNQQAEKLKVLKDQLTAEVDKQKQLLSRVDHRRALQLEQIRIQKSLLHESGKCKALEEELEKPMNIHRWRFLEGTNPEVAQLLRMTHELRDRITMKIAVNQRLKENREKLQSKSKNLENHLTNSYTGNYQEEYRFLSDVLKQKQQQLASIQNKVNEQQTTVLDQKDQVMTIRHMVREEKTEFFDSKKKIEQFRASTSLDKRLKKQKEASQQDPKFIGGGFAIGGVIKSDTQNNNNNSNSLAAKNNCLSPAPRLLGAKSVLFSPNIIHPKSAMSVKKVTQRGWNPKRPPIKPFLPTVSQGV